MTSVKGSVRVPLLDNVWPYDSSANFLRLHALGQLLRRLQLKNDGDTVAGLFEAFDLIVARESPFMRHFCRILSSFASSYRWSYLLETGLFDEDEDSQFDGFRSHPQRGMFFFVAPVLLHSGPRVREISSSTIAVTCLWAGQCFNSGQIFLPWDNHLMYFLGYY